MAQATYTPISLYHSTTAAAVPTSGNLVAGELALNTVDEKLYFKNNAGTVKLLASNAGSAATVSSVAMSVPSFLSVAGSPITSSGTLAVTLSGTALPVLNGGTGQTTYTDGQLLIGNTTGNTLTKTTLTAGSNITITNGSGAITIASSGASAATPTALGTVYGKQTASGASPYLTAYGYEAGPSSTGPNNVYLGYRAAYNQVGGEENVIVGTEAGYTSTGGYYLVGVGYRALYANTTGLRNTALGYALFTNTIGSENVAIGHQAMGLNLSGTDNVAVA